MDRRRFFISGARLLGASLLLRPDRLLAGTTDATLAGTTAAANGVTTAAAATPPFPDLVAARGEAEAATLQTIEALGGMARFVRPGQVVVVKPNASFSCPPGWGATTHPGVLTAVIEAVLAAGARRVLVVDHTMPGQRRCFERNGTADAVAAFSKVKLTSLDSQKSYRPVEVPAGRALKAAEIPAIMQRADVFINLPTAKSHSSTDVSFGLKNLMGLVWDRQSFHRDFDLQMGIADLATVLRPQLTVLDAMHLLKTGGPTGPGDVADFGGVIAGVDPVAVDAYGVGLSAWNGRTFTPDQIPHIRYAVEHGLGTHDLESLRIEELG